MRKILIAAALAAAVAGCGGQASKPPTQHHTVQLQAPTAAQLCAQDLTQMYQSLGGANFGQGEFLAGVNAELVTGQLSADEPDCAGMTGVQVQQIAKQVSS